MYQSCEDGLTAPPAAYVEAERLVARWPRSAGNVTQRQQFPWERESCAMRIALIPPALLLRDIELWEEMAPDQNQGIYWFREQRLRGNS